MVSKTYHPKTVIMSILDALQKYEPELEFQYQALLNGLDWADGFALFFVECSPAKANNIGCRLKADLSTKQHYFLKLEQPIENLYEDILTIPAIKDIDILFILGIEKSFTAYIKEGYGGVGDYYKEDSVPRVLGHLNLEREKLREQLPRLRFVFFLPKFGMKYFIRRAADFFDWRSGYFQFVAEWDLLEQFYQTNNKKILEYHTDEQKKARILELQTYIDEPALNTSWRAECLNEQGYLWATMKNYEAAVACFNKTIQTKPSDKSAWYNLGTALYNLGKLDEAVTAYKKHLDLNPSDTSALNKLWISLFELGKTDEADTAFQKQIEVDIKSNQQAWYYLGRYLYDLGKLDEAVTAYKKHLDLNPSDTSALNNLGNALYSLDKLDEAVAAYQKQLAINPNDKWAGKNWNSLYNLGNIYFNQNKLSLAQQSYAKALEIDAKDINALSNDAELALIQQDNKRCLQRIEQALALVTNKNQKYSILPFLAWLAEPTGSYQPVLNAIAQLDPSVKIDWDFSDTEPAIQRLTTAQQSIARQFIAYFQGNSDKLPDGTA